MPSHDEAMAVMHMYKGVKSLLANFKQDDDLPAAWFGTIYIKRDYYEACTDWCHAQTLLHGDFEGLGISPSEVAKTACQRLQRARLFLRRATETCHDDSHKLARVFLPYIERLDTLIRMDLRFCDAGILKSVNHNEEVLWELPSLDGNAKRWSQPISLPRLKRPLDLFAHLGRLHYFNALCPLMNRR